MVGTVQLVGAMNPSDHASLSRRLTEAAGNDAWSVKHRALLIEAAEALRPGQVREAEVGLPAHGSIDPPVLPIDAFDSMDAFVRHRTESAALIEQRRAIEKLSIPGNDPFILRGFCHVCGSRRDMQVSQMYSSARTPEGLVIPNWREHLNCLHCGTVNRIRGALKVLDQRYPLNGDRSVYITENVTPLFELLSSRFSHLIGSEYLDPTLPGGAKRDGIRHEDIQDLSFEDRSFDLVLSFDVLEHVPFADRAFSELFRVLSPGGRLLFTVPFSYDHAEDVVRATMGSDGTITHLMEPEYHGNPVDREGGALCYRYFGWSVVDQLKRAGFHRPEVLTYWSRELLHFGDPQFVFTASRP